MRKIFQLGGPLGLCFAPGKIDLSTFAEHLCAFTLPDGDLATLQSMLIDFYTPDFSDIGDVSAHRASNVTLSFRKKDDSIVSLDINGVFYWKFIEAVPPEFRSESSTPQEESYINESLDFAMELTRVIYQYCFVNTTMENACPPPLKCNLDMENMTFTVKNRNVLPDKEKDIISSIVDKKINSIDLTDFASNFVDEMLKDGYLIHGFKDYGEYLRPDFTPATWDKDKHKVASDYFAELSHHSTPTCPAYTRWSEVLTNRVKDKVKSLFADLFNADTLAGNADLPTAFEIAKGKEDLFVIQGANKSVDIVRDRTVIAIDQHLSAASKPH